MNRIKQAIRNYFGFSQNETNGFMVLMLLIVLFLFSPALFSYLFQPPLYQNQSDVLILDSMVNEWEKRLNKTSTSLEQVRKDPFPRQFRFDPNTASHEDFSALGFSDIIANRIIKYREMGGEFLTKKDLLKIYDLPDSQFVKLRDFIDLPDKIETKGVRQNDLTSIRSNVSTVPLSININQADTTTLKKIKGIGSFYSRQIVKYREILGGYISTNQYEEVYLMTSELVNTLKRDTYITPDFQPRTINLNSADFKTLLRHPYISYNLASVILSYRKQHGPFSSIEELKNIHLMDDLTFEQLAPYCTI